MLSKLINKIQKDSYYFIASASILALAIVFLSEIVLDLKPCMLCLYQRCVYVLLFLMSLLGILVPLIRKPVRILLIALLIAEVALAGYHTAIEHYLVEESYVCNTATEISSHFQKWLTFKKVIGSCSGGVFKFMNFTMAEWNVLYSSLLTFYFIRKK